MSPKTSSKSLFIIVCLNLIKFLLFEIFSLNSNSLIMNKKDKEILKKTNENINNGNDPIIEAFNLGFMACIQSVNDKGYTELVSILEYEYRLMELR